MKALEQNYRTGAIRVVEVPEPSEMRGRVLVQTAASLVSIGTERAMVEFARKSLFGKARSRPDLVKQVKEKARSDGIVETWRQAMGRLGTSSVLGYSSVGTVASVGEDVAGFKVGDRVSCAGPGYAGHVEMASVPPGMCAAIPAEVAFDDAAFAAVGAIVIESLRLAHLELGHRVVVIGLGLLGQIAVQLVTASGCHVLGVDFDSQKTTLAAEHGAETTVVPTVPGSVENAVNTWTSSNGADAVLIMAASKTNDPLEQAAAICRARGRIVATGAVPLNVPRQVFYEKELELVVSKAWGPQLDTNVVAEEGQSGHPIRWTAKRNMEEFLAQLAKGSVSVSHLITQRYPIDRADEAFQKILDGKERHIGVLLSYPGADVTSARNPHATAISLNRFTSKNDSDKTQGAIGLGLIGAGQFGRGTLLPIIRRLKGVHRRAIASNNGVDAREAADRYGFDYCTTDVSKILADDEIDLVVIATRHDSHAELTAESLRSGKNVLVEKPLAINLEQLQAVQKAYEETRSVRIGPATRPPSIMVGFNRRFSPLSQWMKQKLEQISSPLTLDFVINAGQLPSDSWLNALEQGGGRVVGEVCHFVDLVHYFTNSTPVTAYAQGVGQTSADDTALITLTTDNGSAASVAYLANGDRSQLRERVLISGGGAIGTIENFREATFTIGGQKQRRRTRWSLDRGHRSEFETLIASLRDGTDQPVPIQEYLTTTLTTFAIVRSLQTRLPQEISVALLSANS